jgi:hypothetical protein
MPYFAFVQAGTVQKVERIDSSVMTDGDGMERESLGQQFLAAIYPGTHPGDYVLTTYSPDGSPVPRGCYAGLGFTYDPVADVFVPPAAPEATP